jgi:hypothetical protein
MPTENPILRTVVPKGTADTIAKLAKYGGKSTSAVIREILVEAEPALRQIAGMLQIAHEHNQGLASSATAGLYQAVEKMSGKAETVVQDMLSAMQAIVDKETRRPKSLAGRPGPARRVAPGSSRSKAKKGRKGRLTPVPLTGG